MKEIPINKLNKTITFQILPPNSDNFLHIKEEWQDHITSWAQIKPIFGLKWQNEIISGLQNISRNFSQIIVRYNPEICYDMRIVYKDKIFTIHKITNLEEENLFLEILAEEKND